MSRIVDADNSAVVETGVIRRLVIQHGRLPGNETDLADDTDLYAAGLTSLATVGVMLALEEHFDVEFPESKLNRSTFRSVSTLAAVISELVG